MTDHTIGYINSDGTKQSVTAATPLPTTSGSGASSSSVQGTAAGNAAAVGNPVQTGGIYELTPSTYDNGDAVPLHTDLNGNLRVRLAGGDFTGADATSNSLTSVANSNGVAVRLLANAPFTFNGSTWDRDRKPNANTRLLSAAADTNSTLVKNAAGDVFYIHGRNANAAARYLKLYNKATAPTVGTDTPVVTLYLAAQADFKFEFPKGFYFATGIGFGLTTGVADADTGALTAADILALNIMYI